MAKKTNKAQDQSAETKNAETQQGAKKQENATAQAQSQSNNQPNDPLMDAVALLDAHGVQSFDDVTIGDARKIWAQAACDQFQPRLAMAVFDTALDQGAEIAKRLLQKALGVKTDRDIGAKTLTAIADLPEAEVIELLLACRLRRAAFMGNAHTDMQPRARRVIKIVNIIQKMEAENDQ